MDWPANHGGTISQDDRVCWVLGEQTNSTWPTTGSRSGWARGGESERESEAESAQENDCLVPPCLVPLASM
jgi:hypothetical protein